MANSLQLKEQVWLDNLSLFDNWQDRYQYIMEQGRNLSGIPIDSRLESMLVKGCQSQVWLSTKIEQEKLCLRADSDALIVKGLIAIIIDIYDQQNIAEILAYDHKFSNRIGLSEHLSPARSNGLYSILQEILFIVNGKRGVI